MTRAINRNDANCTLIEAADAGNLSDIESALRRGADVNCVWWYGDTPLSLSLDRMYDPCNREIDERYATIAKLLIENGATVGNVQDGPSPLAVAAWFGHLEIVRMLVERGFERDNVTDYPPLYWAVVGDRAEVVEYLLSEGYRCSTLVLCHAATSAGAEVLKVLQRYELKYTD